MLQQGNAQQERKIESLATIVTELYPELRTISAKGAFRFGVNSALEQSGFENWTELADQPVRVKQEFFEHILDGAFIHLLKMGLPASMEASARERLLEKNEQFLKK